jgi:glycine cleavage system H protein
MKIDASLRYSKHHLWVRRAEDDTFFAGITDYAQDLLGDIVFIEYPEVGTMVIAEQTCGLVESVKTGSDLHAPMNGTVIEINETLQTNPEHINDQPYDAWIFKFKASDLSELENLLLSDTEYQALLNT